MTPADRRRVRRSDDAAAVERARQDALREAIAAHRNVAKAKTAVRKAVRDRAAAIVRAREEYGHGAISEIARQLGLTPWRVNLMIQQGEEPEGKAKRAPAAEKSASKPAAKPRKRTKAGTA